MKRSSTFPNFRTLDLNLLRVFDEVMTERSLTRAARNLSITQPAVSNALRRLRETLGDELVRRSGQGMEPTPRAAALWPSVRDALQQLQVSLSPDSFKPAEAENTFVLAMADATAAELIPRLVQIIESEAPGVSLRVVPLGTRDPRKLLDDEAIDLAVEPALALTQEKFVGGLRLPGDETGDCFKFTQNLAKLAEGLGVEFRYGVNIKRILSDSARITGVSTGAGVLTADAYLVALGSYSPLLLKPVGIRIPVYPVKGYSITVPIENAQFAPESTIMDETHKVAVTRLGDRIRVGGTAELAGYSLALREGRRSTLNHVLTDLFPRAGDVAKGEFWTGLRPMTPDGTPVLGGSAYPNLFLATGHGTLGWTMATGTGKVMADLISGRPTDISLDGLTIDRYRQASTKSH